MVTAKTKEHKIHMNCLKTSIEKNSINSPECTSLFNKTPLFSYIPSKNFRIIGNFQSLCSSLCFCMN